MTSSTPDTVIRTWFKEVWDEGNEETIDRLCASTCLSHGLSRDGSPTVGTKEFKPFFHTFRGAFPDIRVTVVQTVTEGELVTAHCHVTGTHKGGNLGMAATGNHVDFWGICIARIHEGQIVEAWNSFDFLSLYQQVGKLPQL